MIRLEREGIFKAKPLTWGVFQADSGAVGIQMSFLILAQLDGSEWVSWADAEDHTVYGTIWVVKKDGSIVVKNVEDMYAALGWEGGMAEVSGPVPDRVVQVTVKVEEYKGKTQYKVAFIAPENYVPGPQGAAPEDVKKIDARFGSLLRAAAAGAKRAAGGGAPKPAASASRAAPPPKHAAPTTKPDFPAPAKADDIPFREPGDDSGPHGVFVRADALARVLDPKNRDHLKTALADLNVIAAAAADVRALDDATLEKLDERVFDLAIPL